VIDTKGLQVGSWDVRYLPEPEHLSWDVVHKLENFINRDWLPVIREFSSDSPKERWGGLEKFGVPSPIIRVEISSLSGDFVRHIFSIGKKPSLLGGLAKIARQFPEHRRQITQGFLENRFAGVVHIGNSVVQDDKLFAEEILRLPYLMNTTQCVFGKFYWIRVGDVWKYKKKFLRELDEISLVPVSADGCNRELIELHMATRLSDVLPESFSERDIEDLGFGESFVIKPIQGLWGAGVEIYVSTDTEAEKASVIGRMSRLVEVYGAKSLMIQPYTSGAVREVCGEFFHEINRIYFVCLDGKYVFTGGLKQLSHSRKVCGVEGTYFVPLLGG
jgi:hypothetical protein